MENYFFSQGIKVRYTVHNPGHKPIILMHGWGCQGATLASIAKVAAESHTVYSLDFPGFGGSQEPSTIWGVEEYTSMLSDFIKKLQLESPILLGHSFGGRVGILYASRHPEIPKLILVDAAGIKPKRSLKYYIKVYSFKAYKHAVYMLLGKNKAERHLDRKRAKAGSSDYAQASPRMRAILSKVVNEDLKAELPKIKASTLLIWGENDTATPLSDARYMETHIPDAGLVSFPSCGHYSFLDNPIQFSAVLRSFLNA